MKAGYVEGLVGSYDWHGVHQELREFDCLDFLVRIANKLSVEITSKHYHYRAEDMRWTFYAKPVNIPLVVGMLHGRLGVLDCYFIGYHEMAVEATGILVVFLGTPFRLEQPEDFFNKLMYVCFNIWAIL